MIKIQHGPKPGRWLLAGFIVTNLLLSGCNNEQAGSQSQIPPAAVSVYDVQSQKVGEYFEYIGRL